MWSSGRSRTRCASSLSRASRPAEAERTIVAVDAAEQAHREGCGCVRCRGFEPGNGLGRRFEPGNDASRRHGSYATEGMLSRDPRVLELVGWIRETQPVVHAADEGAITRLALVYRRLELSASALDEADRQLAGHPLAHYNDEAAFLERLREDHARWLRAAGAIEAELGRTPASRAKLGLHVAMTRRALTIADLHEETG
jgi:hypothetical protein